MKLCYCNCKDYHPPQKMVNSVWYEYHTIRDGHYEIVAAMIVLLHLFTEPANGS